MENGVTQELYAGLAKERARRGKEEEVKEENEEEEDEKRDRQRNRTEGEEREGAEEVKRISEGIRPKRRPRSFE